MDRTFADNASAHERKRPELDALVRAVRTGDTVLVQSMDRLARNLDDLRRIVLLLTQRGVHIEFVTEQLRFAGDDLLTVNRMLLVMGAFAQFKRALIRERQREGIAAAKWAGAFRGRRKALGEAEIAQLRRRVADGDSKSQVARDFRISRVTLYRYLSD